MKTRSLLLALLFITNLNTTSNAQSADSSKVSYSKLTSVVLATAGAFYYGHVFNTNMWWKGEKSRFHLTWKEDWTYALGSDKFGHFYFPYMATNIYSDVLNWCGVDGEKSLYYSSGVAFAYQTYVEIKDGFSKQWGFAFGDFAANTLGAAYPLLQYKYPELQNFRFKISYYPSPRFRNNSHTTIIDDYESTYDWLSINIRHYLPEEMKKYYPSFVNIAIGHSVKKLDLAEGGNHEFYIGLDWAFENIKDDWGILNTVRRMFSFYHLPAPAVKIYPDVIWYGLKY